MALQVSHIYCLSMISRAKMYFVHKQRYGLIFLNTSFAITGQTQHSILSSFLPMHQAAITAVLQIKQGPAQPCKKQFSSFCVLSDSKALHILNSEPISGIQQTLGGLWS